MIRCVRLWTGEDGNSYFEEGAIDIAAGVRGDWLSEKVGATSISFQETASGGSFDDADCTRKIRTETARALKVDDVNSAHKATPSPVRAAVAN